MKVYGKEVDVEEGVKFFYYFLLCMVFRITLHHSTTYPITYQLFICCDNNNPYFYSLNDGEYIEASGNTPIYVINCGLGGNTSSLIQKFKYIDEMKVMIRQYNELYSFVGYEK